MSNPPGPVLQADRMRCLRARRRAIGGWRDGFPSRQPTSQRPSRIPRKYSVVKDPTAKTGLSPRLGRAKRPVRLRYAGPMCYPVDRWNASVVQALPNEKGVFALDLASQHPRIVKFGGPQPAAPVRERFWEKMRDLPKNGKCMSLDHLDLLSFRGLGPSHFALSDRQCPPRKFSKRL